MGSGNTPRFALAAAADAVTTDLPTQFSGVIDPELRPPVQADAYWLVRPDGYVACASREAAVIASYLEALIVPVQEA